MKPGIQPAHGPVVFRDSASGTARVMDTDGRVERRYGVR